MDEDNKSTTDVFGSPLSQPDGGEATNTEDKEDKGEDKMSPEVIALNEKIADYGKNLSGQRDLIKTLEGKIETLTAREGEKKEGENKKETLVEVSAELTDTQKDDMADYEIALYNKNRANEIAMNKMFDTIQAGNKAQATEKVESLNQTAQAEATSLATEAIKANPELGDVTELTNKILVEFKEYNNEDITVDVLKARIKKSLNNLEGYVAPKEQSGATKGNTAVKGTGNAGEYDPQKVIDSVNNASSGDYEL